ncbi:MAG TPA: SDR family NAD(P)-dependent oxidoreductase [Acidimicrobiales bacterium]|nr:SDR family NAD(P)-dependent oxidoreductase [Acidimicrobiales bacterium]
MGTLDGKVALVTGAGRGIGREEALLLAREGAAVVVNDLGGEWDGAGADPRQAQAVADEIVAAGGRAVANHDSVADDGAANAMVAQAVDQFGHLDIVVNNAGVLRDKMVFNLATEDILTVIQVHLMGTFNTIRHAAAHWRQRAKQGEEVRGSVVNTSSTSGIFGNVGQTNYGAVKAAIASVTQIASMELGRYGVNVNGICPIARTRLTLLGSNNISDQDGPAVEWDPIDPANVAPFVTFLASDAAAEITGQVFGVYGGSVQLYRGWSLGPELRSSGGRAFPVEELHQRWQELFVAEPTAYRSPMEDLRPALQADLKQAGLSS